MNFNFSILNRLIIYLTKITICVAILNIIFKFNNISIDNLNNFYSINSNLFYRKTRFKIKHSIKAGIENTIEWYLANKDWANYQKNRHKNKRIGLDDK